MALRAVRHYEFHLVCSKFRRIPSHLLLHPSKVRGLKSQIPPNIARPCGLLSFACHHYPSAISKPPERLCLVRSRWTQTVPPPYRPSLDAHGFRDRALSFDCRSAEEVATRATAAFAYRHLQTVASVPFKTAGFASSLISRQLGCASISRSVKIGS